MLLFVHVLGCPVTGFSGGGVVSVEGVRDLGE